MSLKELFPSEIPDVRYSEKGQGTKWEGYKVQVTETVDDELPLITDIGIHSAIEADSPALNSIQERLAQRDLLPEQQYVDNAYCNGKTLHIRCSLELSPHYDLLTHLTH